MKSRDADPEIQDRVTGYYNYIWDRNEGLDAKNIIKDLPSSLKSEMAMSMNAGIIDKVYI